MSALEHAVKAKELLAGVASTSGQLDDLSADQRMQMTVSGGFKRVNEDLRWTVDLAVAHALTALALHFSVES